jgi:hypothetical protein
MQISLCKDRFPNRGAKMTSDTVVLDKSRDWATAQDVQERFMRHAGSTVDTLSYSARCRQVRALGGDFYDFMPLPHDRLALAVGDASGKGLAAALQLISVQRRRFQSLASARQSIGGGVTWQEYETGLEGRLADRHNRVHRGARRKQL